MESRAAAGGVDPYENAHEFRLGFSAHCCGDIAWILLMNRRLKRSLIGGR